MVTGLGPGPEFDLIRRFLASATRGAPLDPADRGAARRDLRPAVRIGPGDDCAVVIGDGIAVSVDMAVEDVHFRRAWLEAEEIGWRAAAAGLSDLAAMAARPIGVLAAVALPAGDEVPPPAAAPPGQAAAGPAAARSFGEAVVRGIIAAAESVGAALIGGDLARSPGPLVVDIVALGEAPRPVLRSGARPGDELWVTGTLGGAAAAVRAWTGGRAPDPAARSAFARPRPRTAEALWLAERDIPTAMIDLSDGIAGDAGHLAAAGGVRIVVEAGALPVAGSAEGTDAIRLAAGGGEDYELCFTASPGAGSAVRARFEERFGIRLTRVGRVEEGQGAVVVDGSGKPMDVRAFQHWTEAG